MSQQSIIPGLNTVLLVEPEQGMRTLIANYLTTMGAKHIEAQPHARDVTPEMLAQNYDLICIDWRMKGPSGSEFFRQLRAREAFRETPMVLAAGQVTKDDILGLGPDKQAKFVVKPFTFEVMQKLIADFFKPQAKPQQESQFYIQRGLGADLGLDLQLLKNASSPKPNASTDLDGDADQEKAAPKKTEPVAISLAIQLQIEGLNQDKAKDRLNALIVDEDESLTQLLSNYLEQITSGYVDVFASAKDAWASIEKFPYDLVIFDWRCKGLSGLCFFNRIRMKAELKKIPLIILSGNIAKENFRILEDTSCTKVLEKPFRIETFDEAVQFISSLSRNSGRIGAMIKSAIDSEMPDRSRTFKLLKLIASQVPDAFEFLLLAGQQLNQRKEFAVAERILQMADGLAPNNVTVMTELAKIHLRLDRPSDSLKLLHEANRFSPGNIERLCLMGEAGLNLFDTQKAREYFKEALTIDSESEKARMGLVVAENVERHRQDDALSAKLASTLNLIGIALIKNGKIEAGIEQYHSAMAFIHDETTLAKLQFNLGLAYSRLGNVRLAVKWLEESLKTDPSFAKAKTWLDKVRTGEHAQATIKDEDLADKLADSLALMMQGLGPDEEEELKEEDEVA